jgi:type IVB pilus formation R64 PilN family outer membrane protein
MKYKVLLSALALVLGGCATGTLQPINEQVAVQEKKANEALTQLRKAEPIERAPEIGIRRVDAAWFPVVKSEASHDPVATRQLARKVAINQTFLTPSEATSYVTSLTGIPVTLSLPKDDDLNPLNSTNSNTTNSTSQFNNQYGMNGITDPLARVPITYNGTVRGLMDMLASRYNLFWEWEGNGLRLFRTKSKTFRLAALPGDTSLTARVGTQSSSGSNSGNGSSPTAASSSEQRAGIEFSGMSVWKGIEESIKTMMTEDGKLTVTPATGTLTVDDTPIVLERVAKFVEEQNEALSRQVVINVRVLAVDLSNSDEYGINWDAVYKNISDTAGFGLSLASGAPAIAGATNLSFNILPGRNGANFWNGSKAMFEALSKQGRVSQITSASLMTINNQPAPIQVGRQTSYLASSTTTLGTAGSGNTVSLTPGQVTTGFSMNMLPHILGKDNLMLQFSGDISALTRLNTVSSGGSSIETPDIDTRNFLQRVIMNTGDTIVVTGFEQFAMNTNTQGVGHAENLALGGKLSGSKNKSVLVVLIQPVLMNGPKL